MSMKDEYTSIVKKLEQENQDCLVELPNYREVSVAIRLEIELFTRNLQDTIDFLDHDCTADQLSWMSEVYEEISEKLQSWEFIDALRRAADRFPEECKKYCIRDFIDFAEGVLCEKVYKERYPDADFSRENPPQ